ncbi:CIC family chloride channel protein [Thermonema lapsum]|uniref:CIC family chloride channel protein n=1 Tax=Thermonema lapsum TaxID=28195 RepID=A0A846MMF0_9BACT|nr:chloride channel protein [Thermonema lapsum]NIK72664.1 CIC family chloride channel protein [Thermonema lapsum]
MRKWRLRVRWLFRRFLQWRLQHISDRQLVIGVSVLLGLGVGLVASFLLFTTRWISSLLAEAPFGWMSSLYFIFPIIGILLVRTYVRLWFHGKFQKGMAYVLYGISKRKGDFEGYHRYAHVLTSAVTVGLGGSAGLEAPTVLTGASWGGFFARLFHLDSAYRVILAACGAAAGIAAVFGTPIGGVVFALEVLMANVHANFIVPLLISATASTLISKILVEHELLTPRGGLPLFDYVHLPFLVILGIFCGMVAAYFMWMSKKMTQWELRKKQYKDRLFLEEIFLLGALILFLPPLYGEGFEWLDAMINRHEMEYLQRSWWGQWLPPGWGIALLVFLVLLLKPLATWLTIASGGNGGAFAPTLFLGGTTGYLMAYLANHVLHFPVELPVVMFTLIGMAASMAAYFHAPLTAIFMIAELSGGYRYFVPLMLITAIAYATKVIFQPESPIQSEAQKIGAYLPADKDKAILNSIAIRQVLERDCVPVPYEGTLRELVDAITRSRRNIFPVVDKEGYLKGLILLDDVRGIIFKPEIYDKVLIADLVHAPPAVVDIRESMEEVMDKFDITGAWNLPVTEAGKYRGFLSKSNILSVYRKKLRWQIQHFG